VTDPTLGACSGVATPEQAILPDISSSQESLMQGVTVGAMPKAGPQPKVEPMQSV
jgi:hypothetical protein